MRFLGTIVGAAILIVIVYLVASVIVDGYFDGNIFPNDLEPDSWSAPNSWSEWRDITIVLIGFWMFVATLLLCGLLITLIYLVILIRRLLNNHAIPAIDSLKGSLDNVKGTTEFVGETTVAPIVRVYSIISGIRGGASTLGNLTSNIRGRSKGKKK